MLLPFTCFDDEITVRSIGTSPGFAAPELMGTATVSVASPGGKVTDSLTGVNCVSGAAADVAPSVAEKWTVRLPFESLRPDRVLRTSVTLSALDCWLM